MTHRTILTLGAVLVLARVGAAQERSLLDAEATRITLDDALTRAVARSPQLAQSEQSLVNAGESRRTALGAFLPTISTNSGMSIRSTERFDPGTDRLVSGSSNSYNAGLTARYALFRGGQRFSAFDRAAADLFDDAVAAGGPPATVTKQFVNVWSKLANDRSVSIGQLGVDAKRMGRLARMVDQGTVSATAANRIAEGMLEASDSPEGLAESMGIPEERVFVLEDGDVLELNESEGHVTGKVPAGHVFVDGNTVMHMHSSVFNERRRLAKDGIVAVMITLSRATGSPLEDPGFVSSGFVELEDSQELFEKTSKVVLRTLDLEAGMTLDLKDVQARVSDSVSKYLYDETRRRPTVVTVVQQV